MPPYIYRRRALRISFITLCFLALIFLKSFPCLAQEALPTSLTEDYNQLVRKLRDNHKPAADLTEQEFMRQAWTIGKIMEEDSNAHALWSDYTRSVNSKLETDLDLPHEEISRMRRFFRLYPEGVPKWNLSWALYVETLELEDGKLRETILEQAEKEKWTVREMRLKLEKFRRIAPVLPVEVPALLNIYPVVKNEKGDLTLDLGFGIQYQAPGLEKFKEGDCVQVSGSVLSAVSCTRNENAYSATVTAVVDGDTLEALVDLGFGLTVSQKFRLRGINTPEMNTAEGVAAKQFVYDEIMKHSPKIILRASKLDKYNRYVADVWIDGVQLNEELLNTHHAVPFEN